MANLNNPTGFTPLYTLNGTEISSTPYTAGGTIYRGDLVSAQADGTIVASSSGDGDKVVGVSANYAVSGEVVNIYDNPSIVYAVKASGSVASTDTFATADHKTGTANTVSKLSGNTLDSASIGTGGQMRILRKVEDGRNDWGNYVSLEVVLTKSIFHNATTI